MALEHVLTDVDSLASLALQYLGDASRGGEIAEYNRLGYPYLVKDKNDLLDYFGNGYITVVRANFDNEALIKSGWTFKTNPNLATGGITRVFEVTEDTVIPAGVQVYPVHLRCTVAGDFGNVKEYMITEVGDNTLQLSNIRFLSVYNESKFTGGHSLTVLATGSTIFIPTDSSEVTPENVSKMLALIGGEDLVLDANGDLVIEVSGDLASVSGADNIRYAVATRLITELGDLLHHPEYGTGFQDLIGSPNVANREKLMEIAVYRSLAQEDRIKEVTIDMLSVEGTSVSLSISYKVSISGMLDQVKITM